jgi:putative ABC transport system permease protein
VVVINQKAAERFWPDQDPIGQRVWWNGAAAFGEADSSAEIVGIVGDVAHQPLDERPVQPDFFTAYAQFTYANRMVMVRTRGEPENYTREIAQAVQRADPSLALFDVQTMEHRARLSWSKRTAQTAVFTTIAAIALLLAITGVYAVTASFVASRTREIGVRMALGAPTSRILGASLSHTVRLGVFGVIAGLGGAAATSRLLRAALYDTSPLAAGVYFATAGVLLLALVAASYLPVRRALGVSPAEVLRAE